MWAGSDLLHTAGALPPGEGGFGGFHGGAGNLNPPIVLIFLQFRGQPLLASGART